MWGKLSSVINERNISVVKFCKDVGISTGNFYDWKSERSNPSFKVMVKISRYLDVPLETFVEDDA